MVATPEQEYPELPPIIELSAEDARALFERHVRESFGTSGEEFLRQWDAGEIDNPDRPEIVHLVMMIPFAGRPIMLSRES